ncbi:MAG: SRPBCC family protein [Acidobacteriota bacterium]
MSTVDVAVDIEIAANPADIAAIMFDPQREKDWIQAVQSVELIDPALAPGAKVRHRGSLLGRDVSWITEVETVHFPHVLTMRISDGPFVGTVRYEIQRSGGGSRARVRNAGETTALGFLPAAMIEGPLRAAMTADLARLKGLVEG